MSRNILVGAHVTCKRPVEAYYSGYNTLLGRNAKVYFTPEMVGVVASVDVPSVYRARVTFTVVDFVVDGKKYRCALLNDNIKILLQNPQLVMESEGEDEFPVYVDAQGNEHGEF